MTAFEWTVVGLLFLGLAVPAWVLSLTLLAIARKPRSTEPSSRYLTYSRLLNFLYTELQSGRTNCAPLWVATIRELRAYPEYADLTLLYLEEITVTGGNKFDRVMELEIKATEASLLEHTR